MVSFLYWKVQGGVLVALPNLAEDFRIRCFDSFVFDVLDSNLLPG